MFDFKVGEVYPEQYHAQLEHKIDKVRRGLEASSIEMIESPIAIRSFASPDKHYRMRAEFRVWHQDETAHLCMFDSRTKQRKLIERFDVAGLPISSRLQNIMSFINANPELKRRLFQVEFLSSRRDEVLLTLIYHRPLDEQWEACARELQEALGLMVIGRSRKEKRVLSQTYVTESYRVDGIEYHLDHPEGAFSQPNAAVCETMLGWACEKAGHNEDDLLELYCGSGGFTLPLARHFRRVLATEVSKKSIQTALSNCQQNQVENVEFVRMSSEEFTQAYQGLRPFNRLREIDLGSYQFGTVFVDPPRAGLDDGTIRLLESFSRIIYVSCNPDTLFVNLEALSQTHSLRSVAVFDQFPYTHHIEMGVILTAKSF